MITWLTILFLLMGGAFSMLAGIGIIRMPDLYMRIQAATKAGTLGVGCLFVATMFHFATMDVMTRATLVIGFIFITAPVAAHMIGRAAYHVGVPMWKYVVTDELRDHFDARTQTLHSTDVDVREQR